MHSSRRRFIKVLGSSAVIIAAEGLGLRQCDRMPDAAIKPWSSAGDDKTDIRRWALSYALLAPSPHNMQPWLVDLTAPDNIDLYIDASRLLPETDPFSRQIMIGQGTFLEVLHLALTAQGFDAAIEHFPHGRLDVNDQGADLSLEFLSGVLGQ